MKKSLFTLKITNLKSQLYLNNHQLGAFLTDKLAYYSDNYKYAKAYKMGKWDGKIRFGSYYHPYFTFNTGLLVQVLNLLRKNGIDFILQDERKVPEKKFDHKIKKTLRDYQEEAVEEAIKNQRGVIWTPTGSGKGLLLTDIIAKLGVPTLVLVKSKDLLYQTMDLIMKELDLKEIGCIGAGVINPAEFVTVGMLQTLNKLREDNQQTFKSGMSYFECLVVDEAHAINNNAKSFVNVVDNIPAYYRYAFTATPTRNEAPNATDVTLTASFGPILYSITRKELVEKGYLVDVNVVIVPHKKDVGMTREDYLHTEETPQQAYRAAWTDYILNDEKRAGIIKELLSRHKDEQVLIIADSVELAEKLGKEIEVPVVTGSTDQYTRAKIYHDFKKGSLKVLFASNIFSEGLDFPNLNVVIFAEPFKSPIRLIQRIGRSMRVVDGKQASTIYDIADVNSPFFDRQFKSRQDRYDKEEICYTYLTKGFIS